jgi:hypothetical protein
MPHPSRRSCGPYTDPPKRDSYSMSALVILGTTELYTHLTDNPDRAAANFASESPGNHTRRFRQGRLSRLSEAT